MSKKISVQLYPYRHFDEDNLTSLLMQIATTTCQYVELTSENMSRCPYLFELIDKFRLKTSGIHVGLDEFDEIDLDCKRIIRCVILENQWKPFLKFFKSHLNFSGRKIDFKGKANYQTKQFWIDLAERVSLLGDVTMHSHAFEHLPIVNGKRPWEILDNHLNKNVKFQFDLENIPPESKDYFIDNPSILSRINSVHLDLDHESAYSRSEKLDLLHQIKPEEFVIEQRSISIDKLKQQIYDLNSVTNP